MPNLGNALFFLILWYQLFHHKGKSNLSSGKDAYLSVPRGHLVFSHIIYDRFVLWIIIINNYFYCFLLLLLLLLLLLFSLLILILILSFSFKAVIMNYIIKVMVFTLTSLNQQRNYQVIHKSFYFNFLIFFFLLFLFFFNSLYIIRVSSYVTLLTIFPPPHQAKLNNFILLKKVMKVFNFRP